MSPHKPPPTGFSDEELLDELARRDEAESLGEVVSGGADSTFKFLKSELDTLAIQICEPVPVVPFEEESDCRRVTELVEALGINPSRAEAMPSEHQATEALGTLGQYRLLAKLGQGGMGTVYKAVHTRLDKIVALKVLPEQKTNDAHAVARFAREMRAVGKLEHPNIVRAMDANQEGSTHYLVMEYVEGVDLSELVHRVGPLPIADACELVRQAAVGLQHAAEHGLVHRDIKPSNVMLNRSGAVKILDLGLARLHHGQQGELTSTGQMMGTIDYMAPEQTGDSHVVDIRADIYGLGATLFKLLCDRAPYADDRCDTMIKKLHALATLPVPSVRTHRETVAEELDVVVRTMLAKEPQDRYATPQQVVEALRPFAAECNMPALLATYEQHCAQDGEPGEPAANSTDPYITASMTETHSTHVAECPPERLEPTIDSQPALRDPGGPSAAKAHSESFRPEAAAGVDQPGGGSRRVFTAAAACGGLLLLALVTFYVQTNTGTIVVQIDDPEGLVQVSVVGEDVIISDERGEGQPITLRAGEHKLHVTRGELEFDSDQFTLRRQDRVVLDVRLLAGEIQVRNGRDVLAAHPRLRATAGADSQWRIGEQPPAELADAMQPLGEMAVVSRPAPIAGLQGWTIETLGHRGGTTSVAYSPDGRWLAWGDEQGTIRLWDRTAERLAGIFVGNAGQVLDLDFAPQSYLLASRNLEPAEIRVWEVPTGRLIRRFAGNSRYGWGLGDCCEWSSDGRTLAAVDPEESSRVVLCDVREGTRLGTIPRNDMIRALGWSPTTGLLAVATDKAIDIFENNDGSWQHVHTVINDVPTWVCGLEWSHDGRSLAWIVSGGTLGQWDRETRAMRQPIKIAGAGAAINLRWSPDDRQIAVGAADGVAIYDALNGKELRRLRKKQTYYYVMDWSPEGRMLTAGESLLFEFDAETGADKRDFPGRPHGYTHRNLSAVCWTSDGRAIYCANPHSVARRWTLQDEVPVHNLELPPTGDLLRCDLVALSQDGQQLAAGSRFSAPITIHETGSLETLLTIDAPEEMCNVAWSPDDRMLATVTPGSIDVWDPRDGRRAGSLGGLPTNFLGMFVAWSPDSTTLVVPGSDFNHVRLWRVADDEAVQQLTLERPYPTAVKFSPDGSRLAVASQFGAIELFEIDPARRSRPLSEDVGYVQDLHWDPEGRLWSVHGVPTAACELVCWDTGRAVPVHRTPLPPGFNLAVFSPDGGRLATVTESGQVQLFESATGQLLGTFIPLEWGGNLVVSPVGHYWATPEVVDELVYVVRSDAGQQMLTSAEFAQRFGWRNDPLAARIASEPARTSP